MKTKNGVVFMGLMHAVAAMVYITLVTFVMRYGNEWFGKVDNQLTSIAALMLFVLSAAVMGSLIFLRPALWYVNDKRHETLRLLAWTIAFLFVLTLVVFVCLAIVR
jgi:hypothetical protein